MEEKEKTEEEKTAKSSYENEGRGRWDKDKVLRRDRRTEGKERRKNRNERCRRNKEGKDTQVNGRKRDERREEKEKRIIKAPRELLRYSVKYE